MENPVSKTGWFSNMINIAEQFSRTPAGRYRTDGPSSGERFREEFLLPGLENGGQLEISLDGAAGYPSSFLEEAFGGLVRKGKISSETAKLRLKIIARAPQYHRYVTAIWAHIEKASKDELALNH